MRELKVTPEVWREKMDNLMKRRASVGHNNDNFKVNSVVADYKKHLSKVYVGKSVLDVGCGSMFLKECLPQDTEYTGIDAWPINPDSIQCIIDGEVFERMFDGGEFHTICAFAVMDGVHDFDMAISNMKAINPINIVFLTGIGIPVDEFHTFRLELSDFRERFTDWKETYCEEISPKVYLLEYTR